MTDKEYKSLSLDIILLRAVKTCIQKKPCFTIVCTPNVLLTRQHRPLSSSESRQGLCKILELPVRNPTLELNIGTSSTHLVISNLRG
jgi:hypothetical protein